MGEQPVLSYHLNDLMFTHQPLIKNSVRNIHDISGIFTYFLLSLAYNGDTGVILFFLLSGFLLFLPYAKAMLFDSPWPSFHRFYVRRIFRIVPCYYLSIILLALFFSPWLLHMQYWGYLLLFFTFRIGFPSAGYLNIVFWTMAIEFQFYLLLPIIAWVIGLIVRYGNLHWRMVKLTFCLLAVIVWGLATRYWGLYLVNEPILDFLLPHPTLVMLKPLVYGDRGRYLEVFGTGMFFCMIYTYLKYAQTADHWRKRIERLSPRLLAGGLILIFLLALAHYYYRQGVGTKTYGIFVGSNVSFAFLDPRLTFLLFPYWLEWEPAAYALAYGLCLLALLFGPASLRRPLEWNILRWFGLISFSFYMWHLRLLHLFADYLLPNIQRQGFGLPMQYLAYWCWVLVVIVPITAFLYYCVEKPGIQIAERLLSWLPVSRGGRRIRSA